MRDCTISEGSEVRNRSSIHSPVLNANLEASEETGATNTSRANRDNIIYLLVLDFYQSSKLKFFSFTPSQSSIKYLSTSFLHPTDFVTCLKALYWETKKFLWIIINFHSWCLTLTFHRYRWWINWIIMIKQACQ